MKLQDLLLAAALLTGCSGSVDVGPGVGGSTGWAGAPSTGGAGTPGAGQGASGATGALAFDATACANPLPLPSWPSASECVADDTLPMIGIWNGYVELGRAPWDKLTLKVVGRDSAGRICGSLTVGNGTPPAPATDPDLGYPELPGDEASWHGIASYSPPIDGYSFSLLNGFTDGARLTFAVVQNESVRSWCKLQTSYAARAEQPTAGCTCLPWANGGYDTTTDACYLLDPSNGRWPVNCMKRSMCNTMLSICACNEVGCDASSDGNNYSFDLRFTGDSAEGSSSSAPSSRTYFTRAP